MKSVPQPGGLISTIEPGTCWRLAYDHRADGPGCSGSAIWRGRFANRETSWEVWACDAHFEELLDRRLL